MFSSVSPHTRAALQALLVTFLWSTSWVFIKIGLRDEIPALMFAGLRYTLAFLCLLSLLMSKPVERTALRQLPRQPWGKLAILGLIYYAGAQGAQFVSLAYLPSITLNLILSFTVIVVSLLGMWFLRERPTLIQWGGIGFYVVGALIFFYPLVIPEDQQFGIMVGVIGMLTNAIASVIGRAINREGRLSPLLVTTVSMGIGAAVLIGVSLLKWGWPQISTQGWLIIVWLAVVNTAFAFTLWNTTLRTLSAFESSIISNTMMIQIPILVWVFLGENIGLKDGIGFVIAGLGIFVVQLRQVAFPAIFRKIMMKLPVQ